MSGNKTQPTGQKVYDYIAVIDDEQKRSDANTLLEIMRQATGEEPTMWGTSIVGFGSYHYKYDSGREGDSLRVGFSARKNALTLYGLVFSDPTHENSKLIVKLGKLTSGKGCIYIKKLSDIDPTILKEMIKNAYRST